MEYIKRWLWGAPSTEESKAPEPVPERQPPVRVQPLLQEVPPGASSAGCQGLDWYLSNLRQDADGDCATDFLEEPQRDATDDFGPAPKKAHRASLQKSSKNLLKAAPAATRNSLRVERGYLRDDSTGT